MIDNNSRIKKIKLLKKFFQKDIGLEENLFEKSYLDSLKIIDLILFIEKKNKKKVSAKKINQKSFSTINNIIKLF